MLITFEKVSLFFKYIPHFIYKSMIDFIFTLEQGTVTVRDRDTMEQKVIHVEELISFLMEK